MGVFFPDDDPGRLGQAGTRGCPRVGVAGLQAIATARRLGGDVHAYDVRPETREQIPSLGAKVIDLISARAVPARAASARELSEEGKAKQQALLADEPSKAHIIVSDC